MQKTSKDILATQQASISLKQNHPHQELSAIKSAVSQDLKAVDALISKQLQDRLHLIKSVCEYIINNGGKRIRPLLVILVANALGCQGKQEHITLATIAEFLHTATLLHDDVIDHSTLRRHQKTANHIWDNETSILVGDFLHALSFKMIVDLGNIAAMQTLSNATTTIVTGEVMQLTHRQTPDTSEEKYMEVIQRKTAQLFSAAAELGGIAAQCSPKHRQCLADYGMYLGIAYQLVDDILDYTASPHLLGKNIGDDLAEGKATLPLIYAMKHGSPKETQLIQTALSTGHHASLTAIIDVIQSTQAIEHTRKTVDHYINQAQSCLQALTQDGANCKLLERLTVFVSNRGS